ncbi:MAG: DUF1700 domain-containing protein [Oscillospiraceae bacterium]|nr:DUF1700 domain-containing protein [Oscillospiraceae bacterium]
MNKQEYLSRLRQRLSGLPQSDMDERVAFYSEMIDDRMEDGLSEEDAVAEIGSVDEVVSQIVAETPLSTLVKQRIKPKHRLQAWEIMLLILGFPLWFSLLIAAFAVLFSVYIVIWAVIISLWAVDVSFAAASLGGLITGFMMLCRDDAVQGWLMLGAAIVLAGLFLFLLLGCKSVTHVALALSRKIALWVKSLFFKKEDVE